MSGSRNFNESVVGGIALTMANGRAVTDTLYSDGITSNRRVEWALGTAGAVGALPVSIPFEFDVPTSDPSNNPLVAKIGAGVANIDSTWSLHVWIGGNGGLAIQQVGSSSTHRRSFSYPSFRADYSGYRLLRGMVTVTPGSSTPVFYLNGVDVSAKFTASLFGTPPDWLPSSLDTTKFSCGYNWPAGRFVPHAPILGVLSPVEVFEWAQTGRLPTWCDLGTGSAVTHTNNIWSNRGSPNSYTTFAEASTAGVTLATDGENAVNAFASFNVVAGRKYLLEVTYALNSGVLPTVHGVSTSVATGNTVAFAAAAEGKNTFEFTAWETRAVGYRIGHLAGQLGDFVVSGFKVRVAGPIAKHVIQPIPVLLDTGANKLPAVATPGITPLTDKRDWVIQGKTSTSGNQQLLGASVFNDYTKHMIDTIETNGASTATVSIGSASGGAQYKASAAIASGRNRHTLVTPIPASNNIYITSDTTDELTHTIRGHIID